jgi:hypothetical protein
MPWPTGCPEMAIERLDWHAPQLENRFDYIVGSEIVYQTEAIDCLDALFDRCLNPEGTIILAEGVRRTGVDFWQRMRHRYDVKARRQTLRSDQKTHHMVLFQLQRKTDREPLFVSSGHGYGAGIQWPEATS